MYLVGCVVKSFTDTHALIKIHSVINLIEIIVGALSFISCDVSYCHVTILDNSQPQHSHKRHGLKLFWRGEPLTYMLYHSIRITVRHSKLFARIFEWGKGICIDMIYDNWGVYGAASLFCSSDTVLIKLILMLNSCINHPGDVPSNL